MKPSGAALWLYLLTTSEAGVLPGLILTGEKALAEHLRWPLKGFRRAWSELENGGFVRQNFSVGVVWLPRCVSVAFERLHGSPNLIRGMRAQWLEVPECEIRRLYMSQVLEIAQNLKGICEHSFGLATRP